MATLTNLGQLTMLELVNRMDPKGNAAKIAEVLTKFNPILEDIPWFQANKGDVNEITRRAYLPSPSVRRLNKGVSTSSSKTLKVVEGSIVLEARSRIDQLWLDRMKDKAAARMSESSAFLEGIAQDFARRMFYDTVPDSDEGIEGLATRMGATDSKRVLSNGGSSNLTSIYLVQWGEQRAYCHYPENTSEVGIQHEDLGLQVVQDDDGLDYDAYLDRFRLSFGLTVKDDRCIGRLANIDISAVSGGTGYFNWEQLVKIKNNMQVHNGAGVVYVNQDMMSVMEINVANKSNVHLSMSEAWGEPVLTFRGWPVRMCESISSAETAIS